MKTKKGISLIVLVITVIVMIILATAIILSLNQSNIIRKAQEATNANNTATKKEVANLLLGEYLMGVHTGDASVAGKTANDYVIAGLQANGMDTSDVLVIDNKIIIGTAASAMKSGVKVGDYIVYEGTGNPATYTIPANKSGAFTDVDGSGNYTTGDTDLDQTITRQSVNWQVLRIDEDGVMLISETPVYSVSIGRVIGWKNGASALDDMCQALYGGEYGISRNLKIEDVNKIMRPTFNADDETNWSYKDMATSTEVKLTSGIRTLNDLKNKLALPYITETNTQYLPEAPNYYNYTASTDVNTENQAAYNLMFVNGLEDGTRYFLSSSCLHGMVREGKLLADLNLRYVRTGYIGGAYMGDTHLYEDFTTYATRPVVILDNNISFEQATSNINGVTAWEIDE